MFIKKLVNKETSLYIVFGLLTTVVSFVTFWAALMLLGNELAALANAISFIIAVIFAYFTNKLVVFESKSFAFKDLRREVPAFLGARVLSFLLEEAGIFVCANLLHFGKCTLAGINALLIAKLVLTVIVIVLNYIFSKFFIFKRSSKDREL